MFLVMELKWPGCRILIGVNLRFLSEMFGQTFRKIDAPFALRMLRITVSKYSSTPLKLVLTDPLGTLAPSSDDRGFGMVRVWGVGDPQPSLNKNLV